MYVADCPVQFPLGNILFYADDVKMYKKISSPDDHFLLQDDINRFYTYCTAWGLSMNPEKSSVLTFSLKPSPAMFPYSVNNTPVPRTHVQRDLGVLFDPKCTFAEHINTVKKKCHVAISCLSYGFRNLRSRASYILLYNANVVSRMFYCSVVWAGAADYLLKSLEPLQNRFLRFINWRLSLPKEFSGTELRKRFGVLSVKEKLGQLDMRMFKKLLPNPSFPEIRERPVLRPGMRANERYIIPKLKKSKCMSFFFYRAAKAACECE